MIHGNLLHNPSSILQFHHPINNSSIVFQQRLHWHFGNVACSKGLRGLCISWRGWVCIHHAQFRILPLWIMGKCQVGREAEICDGDESNAILHIQTLRKFPMEALSGKVVMVRFDSALLLREPSEIEIQLVNKAIFTIKYLYNAGSRLLLASDWGQSKNSMLGSTQAVADFLTQVIQLKVVPASGISGYRQPKIEEFEADILLLDDLSRFMEEFANCSVFAEKLSSGVEIFVNDAFSRSHKILSSTVGVTRFCSSSIAGFCFEEELSKVMKVGDTTKHPYIAIIGGGNLSEKATALHHIISKCDGLVFVGRMAFQIMHAQGVPVSLRFVDYSAVRDALEIIKLAHYKDVPILLPKDFWCISDLQPKLHGVFLSHEILNGWTPFGLGPASLKEIVSLLLKSKKVLWIGPVEFSSSRADTHGVSHLAMMLEEISSSCDVTVVGSAACKAVMGTASSLAAYSMLKSASVVWEYLKGRTIPGVAALDRAYPYKLDWNAIFADPYLPLTVDIGSGNGLFLLRMANRYKSANFLGLEINKKLVMRCQNSTHQHGLKNLTLDLQVEHDETSWWALHSGSTTEAFSRHFTNTGTIGSRPKNQGLLILHPDFFTHAGACVKKHQIYFITTNVTSTFRSIISSYPGELILVTIQCPNPDFNKTEHRWRMLQCGLIEAITDLLATDGKIFLQSDMVEVAIRMKELFMVYGKGRLCIIDGADIVEYNAGWLKENPFGIRSDWEQHVLDRGAPMYRLLMTKVDIKGSSNKRVADLFSTFCQAF